MKVLVTGSAGFIGFHTARRLLDAGHQVAGIDAMVPYYDVRLKEARHAELAKRPGFTPHLFDLTDAERLAAVLAAETPEVVIHLAAQAGVRYALEAGANPNGAPNVRSKRLIGRERRPQRQRCRDQPALMPT